MSVLGEIVGNLIGAGVGAFLGYQLGIRQEKKSRVEREDTRIKAMIKSIQEETLYNSNVTGDKAVFDLRSSVKDKEVIIFNDLWINELSTFVLESVISSGNFNLLDPDLQVTLSILLMEIKKVNREVNRLELQFPMKKEQFIERKNKIDDLCNDVLSWIDSANETIQRHGY